MPHKSLGRRLAVLDRGIAESVGARIKAARLAAGLTQSKLAEGRYTKAYISALENGLSKPSLAALTFIAGRLDLPVTHFLGDSDAGSPAWTRLEADLRLASGDWQAAADAYEALLERERQPVRRAELHRGLAEALFRLDRTDAALAHAASAASEFEAARLDGDALLARYWVAAAYYARDNEVEATSLMRSILDKVRAGVAVEPDFEARVLIALATFDGRSGNGERALGYLEEARAVVGRLDDRRRAAFLSALAVNYRERGDLEAALRLANQALARYQEAAVDREQAMLENEVALNLMGMGVLDRAREHAAAADTHFRAAGDNRSRAHIVETQAQIELAAGDLPRATELAEDALRLAAEQENHKAAISASLTLARIARTGGDLRAAAGRMEAAANLAREHARPQQLRDILTEWSDVLSAMGDDKGAFQLSREALQLVRS